MRRRLRHLVLGLVAAVTLSGCSFDVYDLPLPGGTDVGDDPIVVDVMFRDVLDLVPKSTVKVNDVSVGTVTDVQLDGYVARVTLAIDNDVELPDNAVAELRQTSLLGEKFVQLEPPSDQPPTGRLETGDTISIEDTGRNPEVEEVFGALSLLLNGGGVAQLKTIASELNKALEGREGSARSLLRQIELFTGQLDQNKQAILDAIESLNRLALAANEQTDSIDRALEQLPSALRSLDSQRDILIKMLKALDRLGDVGVRVIQQSKAATIDSLRQLTPVLTELAASGQNFVKAFNVFLTYPFVDEVVGRDPQVARTLQMGDYTNLSVEIDLSLNNDEDPIPDPSELCIPLEELPDLPELPPLDELCDDAIDAVTSCLDDPSPTNPDCTGILDQVLDQICAQTPDNPLCDTDIPGGPGPGDTVSKLQKCLQSSSPDSKACKGFTLKQLQEACKKKKNKDAPLCQVLNTLPGGGGAGGGGGGLPKLPKLPGVGRPGFGPSQGWSTTRGPTVRQLTEVFDPGLVTLLVPGMVTQGGGR